MAMAILSILSFPLLISDFEAMDYVAAAIIAVAVIVIAVLIFIGHRTSEGSEKSVENEDDSNVTKK